MIFDLDLSHLSFDERVKAVKDYNSVRYQEMIQRRDTSIPEEPLPPLSSSLSNYCRDLRIYGSKDSGGGGGSCGSMSSDNGLSAASMQSGDY